jgi:predicted ATP-dependent endonuclease of OLD family
MKLRKILLRWYKSFHLNYRGITEKGEATAYRPWNRMSPPYAPTDEFPFIEIPVEADITTIVGANESGKSHLLNAISKVVGGVGIEGDDFERTDLCHFAGVRTRNIEAWPNIGLQFTIESESEFSSINDAAGSAVTATGKQFPPTFAIILAPEEDEKRPARLFVEPNEQAIPLDANQLKNIRKLLPSVQYIDSKALLASEIPLADLIRVCGDAASAKSVGLLRRKDVEEAAKLIQSLPRLVDGHATPNGYAAKVEEVQGKLKEISSSIPNTNSLEMYLFKEILAITIETQKYLYSLATEDRGYIEGQISKWNEAINDRLNLAHFWRQDEQFSLRINYKDGVVYFEIHDKTDSIYTFKERSSGLKFFLSYYIQAKAMEMSDRNHNSIILMDEPDSALSILGQRNLLAVFESLVSAESSKQTCQLIYTTHSPYLINRNFPRRIRVVKKEDAEEGTQYIEQARSRRYEPVRTALGIDSAPSLFLGADNVLLEGPTDQFLLTELVRVFATPSNVGEFLDLNSLVVVSADGVGNVPNVLEQSRWADEPIPPTVIIVDADKAATEIVQRITKNSSSGKALINGDFIKTVSQLVQPFGKNVLIVTTEDIVPRAMYIMALKAYLKRWLPDTASQNDDKIQPALADEAFGKAGLAASTKDLFLQIMPNSQGDYDKMGILQEAVAVAAGHVGDDNDADLKQLRKNVIAVCDFIREGLAKSRAATAKHSTTQAVKRIINDFNRLNKDNVPVTTLQKTFQRLEREAALIGTDGEPFLRLVRAYLAELQKLRTDGQDRVVGDKWAEWKRRIDRIKTNPLTAPDAASSPATPAPATPLRPCD